jgi:hypothetical protein
MTQEDSFKARRLNFKAQTLSQKGTAHDVEFFQCFS